MVILINNNPRTSFRLLVSSHLQKESDFYSSFIEGPKTVKEFCTQVGVGWFGGGCSGGGGLVVEVVIVVRGYYLLVVVANGGLEVLGVVVKVARM